jgi:serine/threonine protein kinase
MQATDVSPPQATLLVPPGESATGPSSPGLVATVLSTLQPGETGSEAAQAGHPQDELTSFLAPPQGPEEIGRLGHYRVLRIIGAGGMGVVFEAEDTLLRRRVALKALLPVLAASPAARQRFLREAQSAACVEHEHIVAIHQVGEDRGVPFLAMPLLKGEPLDERLKRQSPLSVAEALRITRETALALQAAHERGLMHRDIKPANIFLEGREGEAAAESWRTGSAGASPSPGGRVKILDFGLARTVEDDQPLTQQGTIMGTPAYMSPEQGQGAAVDHRSDLFSLGCVLYHMVTGRMPFQGPSAVATLMAVASHTPETPSQILVAVPEPVSRLVMHLLAKKPEDRPASARSVVETIDAITSGGSTTDERREDTAETPSAPPTRPTHSEPVTGARPPRRWRWVVLAVAGVILVAGSLGLLAFRDRQGGQPGPAPVTIGIAYGTEKRGWLEEEVRAFRATPEGSHIEINLIPKGSLEGAQAIARDQDQRIHVWSPASSLYRDTFVHDWQARHGGKSPILKSESLALTPLVFVMWKERHDAFVAKYREVSFTTIISALQQPGGWQAIAGRPQWGRFRFNFTNPEQSNSGLMTLVLLAHDTSDKDRGLTSADVTAAAFGRRLEVLVRGGAGRVNSTGNLMKEMVARGPSAFDAVLVYENVAIEFLGAARGRWGELRVSYPGRNLWSESPYCILDVPWSGPEHREAAEAFLRFLLSEPAQKRTLAHGFRPANVDIPIRDIPTSPFVRYRGAGLTVALPAVCDPPGREVLDGLLRVWEKARREGK